MSDYIVPFKNQEECLKEMKRHEPFGWVINIEELEGCYHISYFDDKWVIIGELEFSYEQMVDKFTFLDGSLFGRNNK